MRCLFALSERTCYNVITLWTISMNYSTILGITIGTLLVFIVVFIFLSIYFPIVPNFFFPFLQTRNNIDSGTIILTPMQRAKLVEEMTAEPQATSSLSHEEVQELKESTTAKPTPRPSLSEEERKELLESMTVKKSK